MRKFMVGVITLSLIATSVVMGGGIASATGGTCSDITDTSATCSGLPVASPSTDGTGFIVNTGSGCYFGDNPTGGLPGTISLEAAGGGCIYWGLDSGQFLVSDYTTNAVLQAATPYSSTASAIASGFTGAQVDLLGYLALAIVLTIALMVVGLGITLLVKWARRAVHST